MAGRRTESLDRGIRLVAFSLAYNLVETAAGVGLGLAAGSVALLGFGLDSVVESSSAAIVLQRLRAERSGARTPEEAERRAIKAISIAFFLLAAYVGVLAVYDLVSAARPESSVGGVVLAVVSVIVMPVLAWRKRLVAGALNSRAVAADSVQTSLCTYISVALLAGLAANSALGWWWADPGAGLLIAAIAVKEGRELWRYEDLCC